MNRKSGALSLLAALLIGLSAPALAVPLMDMKAEDLVPMASEFRKELNLNANQQTLWSQVETRSKNLLRERKARREKLEASTQSALGGKDVELRELTGAMDAETSATAAEDKQLREWWLTVNDALDENQRRQVASFIAEVMTRKDEGPGRPGSGERPAGDGGGRHRGGHGGMGVPGAGGPTR
ncbi:hypothetical protein ACHMW6_33910 [Pseudoduganella sp. UC29_106]|uniref:hypothetical protein n=1 Tax=Pseudoduganella sp. UC29_106 TaxID=3374553 RepID=UPI003757788E